MVTSRVPKGGASAVRSVARAASTPVSDATWAAIFATRTATGGFAAMAGQFERAIQCASGSDDLLDQAELGGTAGRRCARC